MRLRCPAAFACTLIWFNLTSVAHGDAVPAKYFGTYPGLELHSVKSGASWEESLTGLEISGLGITRYALRDQRGRDWKLHYPTTWILAADGPCLAIKRDTEADRPELVRMAFALCFDLAGDGRIERVRMFNANAEPVGEYLRDGGDQARALWQLRDRFDTLRESAREDADGRRGPRAEDARQIIRGHDDAAKLATLREIRLHAPEMTEAEIPAFVGVIGLALWDRSHVVQKAAVEAIERGALFTQAVEPLRELASHPNDVHPEVLSRATRALGALVYEANHLFERRESFREDFGTIDVDQLFARTGGVIEANDSPFTALDVFKLHPPLSRAWTPEIRERLLRTLDTLAIQGPSPDARREAQQIARVLGRPLKTCESVFAKPKGGAVGASLND